MAEAGASKSGVGGRSSGLHNKPAGCSASEAYAKGPDGRKRTEQKPKVTINVLF